MKRLDYLKLALNDSITTNKSWIVTAFAIVKDVKESEQYYLKLSRQSWGLSFVNIKGELERIDDSKPNEPLFKFKEKIEVDTSWAANIKNPITTSIGNMLFNRLCILPCFGTKMGFFTERLTVERVEELIAVRLKDTPKEDEERIDEYFYVDEYIKFRDSLDTINTLSQLCTWAATPKNITPPTGIEKFKAALDIEYYNQLSNPIKLAEYEAKLKKFDADYLADDPSNDTFITKKMRENSRKQLFLTVGGETGFDENKPYTFIRNSLNEGWSTEPKEYTAMMNGLRSGSFSRGAETVNGGVAAKILLRAANSYRIVDNDCGTKLGIKRNYTNTNINYLVGRKILLGNNTIIVDNIDDAKRYIDQDLVVRSPMYCKSEGETICANCASIALSQYSTGLTIPLTEISSIILATSMAKMHSNVLSVTKLNIDEVLS